MSRINRTPIQNGQEITAADLNTRYTDFTQPAALDEFNAATAAIDLPQFQVDWQAPYITQIVLGEADLLMATPNSIPNDTSYPATGAIVQDYSAVESVINFGITGKTISTREILRLYWSLTVQGVYDISGTLGPLVAYTIDDGGGGSRTIDTSQTCWVMYPEWDITSNALANFVPVPGQSDFQDTVGAYEGAALEDCMATTVIPGGWVQYDPAAEDGALKGVGLQTTDLGWRGVSGAWHYSGEESGAVTVYGIRWRIIGLCHPYNTGGVNYLVVDTGGYANPHTLEYTSGVAQAIIHRTR